MKSEALKIAEVSAPSGTVIVDTIELLHEDFPAPIRLTNQFSDFTATLEATAPQDALASVTFSAAAFKLTLPKGGLTGVQSLNLAMGNVDKVVNQHLEIAALNPVPITCIYRQYVSTDTSAPGVDPPQQLTLISAIADPLTVNAAAKTQDWINKKIHTKRYNGDDFPNLNA